MSPHDINDSPHKLDQFIGKIVHPTPWFYYRTLNSERGEDWKDYYWNLLFPDIYNTWIHRFTRNPNGYLVQFTDFMLIPEDPPVSSLYVREFFPTFINGHMNLEPGGDVGLLGVSIVVPED